MTNWWNQKGIPHKGWTCSDLLDLRGDGQSEDETDYATCEMCGNEKVRYVHVMTHPEYFEDLQVGCSCAEKMSEDYTRPKEREKVVRNRSARREKWLKRAWRTSSKGNKFLNINGNNVGVQKNYYNKWSFWINQNFSPKLFLTEREAKLALFDALNS